MDTEHTEGSLRRSELRFSELVHDLRRVQAQVMATQRRAEETQRIAKAITESLKAMVAWPLKTQRRKGDNTESE